MTIEMGVSTKYEANDIGIIAMDIYFPPYFVEQQELEDYYGVSAGKYTIGLEQEKMAVCPENEDAISMAMNGI
jgi:hydroxymethylglutaryl-CoA synthase